MFAEPAWRGRMSGRRPIRDRGATYLAAAAILDAVPLLASARSVPHASPAAPVFGGTLKIVAGGGPTNLDPVPAYYTANYILERAYARQLLSYPAEPDPGFGSAGWRADVTPVPDVAATVPTVANGGITNGGKTYTLRIRPGVLWNSAPVRSVVSADFLREFKAFCNPVSPVGNLSYYTATIQGLRRYCSAEAARFAGVRNPTATQIAYFQNTHAIIGIAIPNPATIVFHLNAPASDFDYMLTLPFASARPVEYDRYLPGSARLDRHLLSDGPYQITSNRPGRSMTLQRNPAWSQASDPIRHQYVKTITVTMGVTDATTVLADQRAGKFDLSLDIGVPTSAIHRLLRDPDFRIWPGDSTVPYTVFNLRSPNSRGAMRKINVRKAIEYAVNKAAVQQIVGGPSVSKIINTVIPPGNVGFVNYNLYRTRGERGSAATCRSLLAKAGYRRGLKLRYMYQNDSINASIFQAIQASLRQCRITLIGEPRPGYAYFTELSNTPRNNRPGTFDLASAGWIPDWYGDNGRTFVAPLFQTDCVRGTINYGCYSNSKVDRLIRQAEAAPTLRAAAGFWHQADVQIMKDAAFVPMIDSQNPIYASKNVRQAGLPAGGVVMTPNIGGPDITNIWLKNG